MLPLDLVRIRHMANQMVPEAVEEEFTAAATSGDVDALRRIFADNPILNVKDAFNFALHEAVASDKPAAVEYLLSRGADPQCTDICGYNTAHAAIRLEDQDSSTNILRILFEKDPTLIDSRAKQTSEGHSCLHLAIGYNKVDVLNWLLDKGADTTVQATDGSTSWDLISSELTSSSGVNKDAAVDLFCAFVQREARNFDSALWYNRIEVTAMRNLRVYQPTYFTVSNFSTSRADRALTWR